MAFSEMGTFHLGFTLNWNKLINITEWCLTIDLWNKSCFSDVVKEQIAPDFFMLQGLRGKATVLSLHVMDS